MNKYTCDLCADVAELGGDTEEKLVVLPERTFLESSGFGCDLFCL